MLPVFFQCSHYIFKMQTHSDTFRPPIEKLQNNKYPANSQNAFAKGKVLSFQYINEISEKSA